MSLSTVIIGLGNPGEKYSETRHNSGWMVLDDLARKLAPVYESEKWRGILAEKGEIGLFKPLTYMNESGKAVKKLLRAHRGAEPDILVVSDDLALDLGYIRIRPSGSSGGHNGLQSVIDHLGSDGFARLRVGIGPRPDAVPARAFVLGRFCRREEQVLRGVITAASDAVLYWMEHGAEDAMDRFNGRVI